VSFTIIGSKGKGGLYLQERRLDAYLPSIGHGARRW